ncbi:MAG: hypothetical protein HYS83_01345 [Candidatus Blackburnbacteria bacterium]|nr:hypothetical protein [Candidatus Blackburnbacteria bacterium]
MRTLPPRQKGIIHILPLEIIVVLVIAGVLVYLVTQGIVKLPSVSLFQKKPNVELQETYKNPFKKETQFVNPFETYKNPFTVGR